MSKRGRPAKGGIQNQAPRANNFNTGHTSQKKGWGVETNYLTGESKSVWNFSLCPGWTPEEY